MCICMYKYNYVHILPQSLRLADVVASEEHQLYQVMSLP